MLDMEAIKNFSIDKSDWQKVKFGDVVFEPKESVKDPVAEGIEHVVGLEHINSEDIHLRRSASTAESTTFTKKFSKGDVLFGRRRAYLKKAAKADFEGICSGDITVMRAKEELLIPELLPFIVNNDNFFDYAITHSAGGLSPRVKFKDLSQYELYVPNNLALQKRIAELMIASDKKEQKNNRLISSLEKMFLSERKHLIERGVDQNSNSNKIRFGKYCNSWPTMKLGSFCKLVSGNAFKSTHFQEQGKYQVLRIGNLTNKGFDYNKSPVFVNDMSSNEEKFLIPEGAIVLSLTGTNGKRDYGFPSLMCEGNKYLLNQRLVMLLVNEQIMIPEFLFLLAKMEIFQGRFFLNATGTANQANVSIGDVAEIELPIPPLKEQELIVKQTASIITTKRYAYDESIIFRKIKKQLINKVF